MESHPAAKVFPLMKGKELQSLVADIGENGLLDPIVTHEDLILDGRNRLVACRIAGVTARFSKWDNPQGMMPIDYVISKNLHRRQLTIGERITAAAEASILFEAELSWRSAAVAAERFGISRTSVDRALRVLRAAPEEFARIKTGELGARTAADHLPSETTTAKKIEIIKARAAEGHTTAQVATELGLVPGRVSAIAREQGIKFPATVARKTRRLNMGRIVREIILTTQGIETNINLLNACDDVGFEPSEATEWIKSLTQSVSELRGLVKLLKKLEVPVGSQETKERSRS